MYQTKKRLDPAQSRTPIGSLLLVIAPRGLPLVLAWSLGTRAHARHRAVHGRVPSLPATSEGEGLLPPTNPGGRA